MIKSLQIKLLFMLKEGQVEMDVFHFKEKTGEVKFLMVVMEARGVMFISDHLQDSRTYTI